MREFEWNGQSWVTSKNKQAIMSESSLEKIKLKQLQLLNMFFTLSLCQILAFN